MPPDQCDAAGSRDHFALTHLRNVTRSDSNFDQARLPRLNMRNSPNDCSLERAFSSNFSVRL